MTSRRMRFLSRTCLLVTVLSLYTSATSVSKKLSYDDQIQELTHTLQNVSLPRRTNDIFNTRKEYPRNSYSRLDNKYNINSRSSQLALRRLSRRPFNRVNSRSSRQVRTRAHERLLQRTSLNNEHLSPVTRRPRSGYHSLVRHDWDGPQQDDNNRNNVGSSRNNRERDEDTTSSYSEIYSNNHPRRSYNNNYNNNKQHRYQQYQVSNRNNNNARKQNPRQNILQNNSQFPSTNDNRWSSSSASHQQPINLSYQPTKEQNRVYQHVQYQPRDRARLFSNQSIVGHSTIGHNREGHNRGQNTAGHINSRGGGYSTRGGNSRAGNSRGHTSGTGHNTGSQSSGGEGSNRGHSKGGHSNRGSHSSTGGGQSTGGHNRRHSEGHSITPDFDHLNEIANEIPSSPNLRGSDELRVGKALNIFSRYGFLTLSVKVKLTNISVSMVIKIYIYSSQWFRRPTFPHVEF